MAVYEPHSVIIRTASYLEQHIDPNIEIQQAESARASDVSRIGAYVWGYLGSDPEYTAEYGISRASFMGADIRGEYPSAALWIDLEDSTCATDVEWIRRFGERCRSLGVVPGIYTRRGWWQTLVASSEFSDWPLWDANYNYLWQGFIPYGGWSAAAIQQWTSSPIDQNIINEEPEIPTQAEFDELKAQVEVLTTALAGIVQDGTNNIQTIGNISMIGPRDPSNPRKFFMGPSFDRGVYLFSQERFAGQGSDEWGGIETYRKPDDDPSHASWGYGADPGRMWWQNFLLEANGDQVGVNVVANRIYLQQPKYRNLQTGGWEKPYQYHNGVPCKADGTPLGGIQVDFDDLGSYITRDGDRLVLYHGGVEVDHWPK